MNVRTTRLAAVGMAVVFSSAMEARADLIFSNFDSSSELSNFWVFPNNQPATEYEAAIRFQPTMSFFVDAMELPVLNPGEDFPFYSPLPPPGSVFGDSMRVVIYADNNGTPGQVLETIDALDSVPLWEGLGAPSPPATMVEFAGTTLLEEGHVYWIGLVEVDGSVVGWQYADVMAPWQRRARIVGGPWDPPVQRRYGLRIYGTPDPQCDGDITGDGEVNVNDLLSVISTWGSCPAPCPPNCVADIVPNCAVDVNDLLAVVTTWGPCP